MEITLNKLKINQTGIVKELYCCNNIKTRLQDLGIVTGTKITPLFRSMLGNPTAYTIRNSLLAIRDEDAEKIIIYPL